MLNGHWLLADDAMQALSEAARVHSRAQLPEAAPRRSVQLSSSSSGVVTIRIHGVLTKYPDRLAALYGGGNTAYTDIVQSLDDARLDSAVNQVVLDIDSPGGHVRGLFEALAAVERCRAAKSITVSASNAQSAAYALAAAAGRIEATNVGATFGSIGVAVSAWLDPELVHVTSTEAPDKRPDLATESGKAVVRKQLDALHELFADAIAQGRGTTAGRVNESFGRGATLLAHQAMQLGMIDSIAGASKGVGAVGASASSGDIGEAIVALMDERSGRSQTAIVPAPAHEPRADAPEPVRDLGDCVSELLAAEREGRQPAAWAITKPQAKPVAPPPASPPGPIMRQALDLIASMNSLRKVR